MAPFKTYLLIVVFLFSGLIYRTAMAQETPTQTPTSSETETVQVDDNSGKEKKKDKKKNKDAEANVKDEIQIGETFYISLLIDLITVIIIVVFIYFPNYRKQEVFFTYFLFNIAIFLLTFLLNKIKISMGAAFGLFAVFSMLRYRTEGISMKDMTYLFIVISVGLMSAIQLEYYELGIINGVLIIFTFALDGNILMKREFSKLVQYENIEMIKPENHTKLIEDLRARMGLNIHRISINRVDFLRDMAWMDVYYYAPKNKKSSDSRVEYSDNKPE